MSWPDWSEPLRRLVGSVAPGMLVVGVAWLALAGCGDTSSQPAWVPGHPDTSRLSFQTTAPGVCAITVRYPNDAPAAIGYLGNTYVQVGRQSHPAAPGGSELDHSGDWHVYLSAPNGDLLLVTPADAFDYRLESNC
ncbi:MAG: hypothetical protein JF887_01165 [Candidatus Dormibacteraeota bacterium]|uniref:Uncharacterized protein n=1 Tax=Candidatus Amunia macphersoniae TaxID=3127014 RepID=A0A934KJT5_9BACT|nr:hypothetical protein [Candidatus Dormibacteraeota bacterium]